MNVRIRSTNCTQIGQVPNIMIESLNKEIDWTDKFISGAEKATSAELIYHS